MLKTIFEEHTFPSPRNSPNSLRATLPTQMPKNLPKFLNIPKATSPKANN
jgi:hypothetical protein